jgi:protein gp37
VNDKQCPYCGAKLIEARVTHTFGRIDDGQLPALPLPGVWLGTTTESQATADKRIPALLGTPAAVRFLSYEPLLGEISLGRGLYSEHDLAGMDEQYLAPIGGNSTAKIDWVIAGGESGPEARPMHPQWAMSIRDQCEEAGTPYFFKQWGEWCPSFAGDGWPEEAYRRPHHYFDDPPFKTWRVGRAAAGCLLDGREWKEFPEVPA